MPTNSAEDLWKSIKGELEVVANPTFFKTTIPGAYIKSIDENDKIIEITAPNDFHRNRLEERFYGHLRDIVTRLVGSEYKLSFTVTKKDPEKLSRSDLGPLFEQGEEMSVADMIDKTKEAGLNPQYTMQRFVVGDNNRLAYAVSTAIVDSPAKVYNPFFLYAGVGLGKTHLIQAIGHQILQKHPEMTVLYKTGEQFVNEVIEAVRRGSGQTGVKRTALKKKYRNVDVLIVDDIHSIAGKDSTQEEFFHTFNTLYMAQKQIILTSDRAPHEIRGIEERLSSRFASGMIADIQKPDWETRMAILKNRNEEMHLGAPDEVLEHLASVVDSNIRELEAKLLQTATQAKSRNLELNMQSAIEIIGQIDKEKGKRVTPQSIMREISRYYGVTMKDLKGQRRLKSFVLPRQICMYFLRDIAQLGVQGIGEFLGGRDHSTVIHGIDKIEKRSEKDAQFSREIRQIRENIFLEASG